MGMGALLSRRGGAGGQLARACSWALLESLGWTARDAHLALHQGAIILPADSPLLVGRNLKRLSTWLSTLQGESSKSRSRLAAHFLLRPRGEERVHGGHRARSLPDRAPTVLALLR